MENNLNKRWMEYCRASNKAVTNISEALLWAYLEGQLRCTSELTEYTDRQLVDKLRERGYVVKATKTQIIEL